MKHVAKDFFKWANHIGIWFVLWYLICFVWFYVRPGEQVLFKQLMEFNFFYFSGMNLMSFIAGGIQSYIWGYVVVGTWVLASKISGLSK